MKAKGGEAWSHRTQEGRMMTPLLLYPRGSSPGSPPSLLCFWCHYQLFQMVKPQQSCWDIATWFFLGIDFCFLLHTGTRGRKVERRLDQQRPREPGPAHTTPRTTSYFFIQSCYSVQPTLSNSCLKMIYLRGLFFFKQPYSMSLLKGQARFLSTDLDPWQWKDVEEHLP